MKRRGMAEDPHAMLLQVLCCLDAGESRDISSVCVGRADQAARRREESTKHRQDAQSGVRGIQGRSSKDDL